MPKSGHDRFSVLPSSFRRCPAAHVHSCPRHSPVRGIARILSLSRCVIAALLALGCAVTGAATGAFAQTAPGGTPAASTGNASAPSDLVLSLEDALRRARTGSIQYLAAAIDTAIAAEDRTQAKAALLPSLSFFNEYIYTQGNGTDTGIFVSADGVHVYSSQGVVHAEPFSPERLAEYRRAIALEAVTKAKQDVALRGVARSVVENYYAIVLAGRQLAIAQRSLADADMFLETTRKLERGGEVARADTVKAEILFTERQRNVEEAIIEAEKARIELAALIFPSINQSFRVVDDLDMLEPVPSLEEIDRVARGSSPEIQAARNNLRAEELGVAAARGASRPSVSFDYFFGINANRFAASSEGVRNLGSQAQATLNIPIFNGGALKSRIHQAELKRQQAELETALAEREFEATLRTQYQEAVVSRSLIDSLRHSADLASESLRLTLLRYQAGEVTVLEVVDAQTTLTEVRRALEEGLTRYRTRWVNIQILMGNF
ncbi:MAG TPA: TolC family protein [Terriglobia bacterium]|nr:TolC family protein [Terriglobia bacterium]